MTHYLAIFHLPLLLSPPNHSDPEWFNCEQLLGRYHTVYTPFLDP